MRPWPAAGCCHVEELIAKSSSICCGLIISRFASLCAIYWLRHSAETADSYSLSNLEVEIHDQVVVNVVYDNNASSLMFSIPLSLGRSVILEF